MQVCIQHEPVEIERKRKKGVPLAFCVCKDLGMDCSYEATGTTEIEVMRKFIDHAEPAHKMQVLSADVIFRVQNAIRK